MEGGEKEKKKIPNKICRSMRGGGKRKEKKRRKLNCASHLISKATEGGGRLEEES